MPFTIKPTPTKCTGCVHAHIVKAARTGTVVTMCRLLSNLAVGPIDECNQFLPHIHAPIPMSIAMQAWTVDLHRKDKEVGFKPPPKPQLIMHMGEQNDE